MKIYYGMDRKAFAPHIENPMVSVRSLMNRKTPMVTGKKWFMDCGAYTYLRDLGKFPFTYGKYLGVVKRHKPDLWSSMDWCCEPDILKSTKLTVLHHIANTVDSGMQLIDFDKDHFVMIIQGWDIKDYMLCVDRIRDQGLFTKVMGVGTVCCRKNPRDVYELIKQLKASLPDWVELHCFGLSIDMLKYKEIYDQLDSIDTYAWNRPMGLVLSSKDNGGYNKMAIGLLDAYKKRVEQIITKNTKQSVLSLC